MNTPHFKIHTRDLYTVYPSSPPHAAPMGAFTMYMYYCSVVLLKSLVLEANSKTVHQLNTPLLQKKFKSRIVKIMVVDGYHTFTMDTYA